MRPPLAAALAIWFWAGHLAAMQAESPPAEPPPEPEQAAPAPARAAQPAPPEKPVSHWIDALNSPDAAVRLEAVEALAKRGPQAEPAVPALITALGDGEANVRAGAARALGAVGPGAKAAIAPLIQGLADEGYAVMVEDELPEAVPVWFLFGTALGQIGPAALPELIKALDHENPQVCVAATAGLHELGPAAKEAVEPLVKLLRRDQPETRRGAIYGLMGIGPEAAAAVPALIDALGHEDFHTQYWACRALREIGPGAKAAVPVLMRLLADGVPSVRRNAAQALGGIGPDIGEEGLRALANALGDPLEPVREDAAVALGRLGPWAKPAAPKLEEALAKGPLAARAPAARSLWLITGQADAAVDVLIGELADLVWRDDAVETLGQIGPAARKAVPALVELLNSPDLEPETRTAAAAALKRIGPNAPVPESPR